MCYRCCQTVLMMHDGRRMVVMMLACCWWSVTAMLGGSVMLLCQCDGVCQQWKYGTGGVSLSVAAARRSAHIVMRVRLVLLITYIKHFT